jgi:hypothetical protein
LLRALLDMLPVEQKVIPIDIPALENRHASLYLRSWKPAFEELDYDICHTDALIRTGRLHPLMQVGGDQAIQANGCRCGIGRLGRRALFRSSGCFCHDYSPI